MNGVYSIPGVSVRSIIEPYAILEWYGDPFVVDPFWALSLVQNIALQGFRVAFQGPNFLVVEKVT